MRSSAPGSIDILKGLLSEIRSDLEALKEPTVFDPEHPELYFEEKLQQGLSIIDAWKALGTRLLLVRQETR